MMPGTGGLKLGSSVHYSYEEEVFLDLFNEESPPAPLDKGGGEAPATLGGREPLQPEEESPQPPLIRGEQRCSPLGRRESLQPEESPPAPLDKGGAEAQDPFIRRSRAPWTALERGHEDEV